MNTLKDPRLALALHPLSIEHYAGWRPRLTVEQACAWLKLCKLVAAYQQQMVRGIEKATPQNMPRVANTVMHAWNIGGRKPSNMLMSYEECELLVAAKLVLKQEKDWPFKFMVTQAAAIALVPRHKMIRAFYWERSTWIQNLPLQYGLDLVLAA